MARSDNDCRIDYIEMNVADIARAKGFYGAAFGWTFKDYGSDYCEFGDGRLTGGFSTHGKPSPGGGPLVILYADDLPEVLRRVEAAGGRISTPPFDFPGGRRFHFTDPEGYEFGVWTKR